MFLLLCIATITANAQIERPKLVVGLVVDQMRWDYLYYYHDDFSNDGFKRLLREGFSCENTMINYVPTITAVGHTSLYTGSVPALHGICGNDFMLNGKKTYCCSDTTVTGIGSDTKNARMSPRKMLANTIGDQLHLFTDYRAKVIGVALKDRAAILPAGHSADAAYWYDTKVGHFVTSSYYTDRFPKWVDQFNRKNNTKPGFDIKTSNQGVTMTFKMAEAALKNEKLGKGEDTDMLCVSISSTDAIGHEYSTRGKENYEVYMQLDKDLGNFLKTLDKEVGEGNYLLFLSADHGASHNPYQLQDHNIPGGYVDMRELCQLTNEHIKKVMKINENVFARDLVYDLVLDWNVIDRLHLDEDKVKAEAVKFLRRQPHIINAFDIDKIGYAPIPEVLRERIANGHMFGRSGDVTVIVDPSHFTWKLADDYMGTTHGAWNPYDAHIPLVFFGWHIKPGQTSTPTYIVDAAPTICELLHMQMPNSCVGNAIECIVNPK